MFNSSFRTTGDDAAKMAFRKALMRHAAIQEQVAGATAEAGRALQQMKMVAGLESNSFAAKTTTMMAAVATKSQYIR